MLDKNFMKGYFRGPRSAKAEEPRCGFGFRDPGLGIESGNKDLKNMKRELEEETRLLKVPTVARRQRGKCRTAISVEPTARWIRPCV